MEEKLFLVKINSEYHLESRTDNSCVVIASIEGGEMEQKISLLNCISIECQIDLKDSAYNLRKSLPRKEWEVEIVQVPAKQDCKEGETNYFVNKLDDQGCLVLKRK